MQIDGVAKELKEARANCNSAFYMTYDVV